MLHRMLIHPTRAGIAPLVHGQVPEVPGFLDGRLSRFGARRLALTPSTVDDRGHDRHELGRLHG